jgi:ABC-type transport system involved in cytochrome c biogenesis permease subunit
VNSIESIFFWAAAVLCGASFFSGVMAVVFRRARPMQLAHGLLVAASFAVLVVGIVRWERTGHPPFVTIFESMLTSIWFVLVIHSVLRWRRPQLDFVTLPVALVALLLLGWSSSLSQDATPLSAALTNVWLFIHASFATSGAATFLVAASLAAVYLLGEERLSRWDRVVRALPGRSELPRSILNFLIFGLILWGVMIASGSVWAHSAWGRYWAWDPIELWSLIGWLVYALLIHARITFKLSHRLFSVLTIAAAFTVVFALWGVQYVYKTIHTYG